MGYFILYNNVYNFFQLRSVLAGFICLWLSWYHVLLYFSKTVYQLTRLILGVLFRMHCLLIQCIY